MRKRPIPLLDIHLEFNTLARIAVPLQAAHAGVQILAAVHRPGERGVLRARHVAELVAMPVHADSPAVVDVVRFTREIERVNRTTSTTAGLSACTGMATSSATCRARRTPRSPGRWTAARIWTPA